jgi:glyoxylase-like metal-dependent hydrolase (beta-lactamase superfamily II)
VFQPYLIDAHNPGPMTGAGNHTYLLIGRSGVAALIDAGTGAPEHLTTLAARLEEAGARLEQVLVTHSHHDHASGAPAVLAAHPSATFLKHVRTDLDGPAGVPWRHLADGDRLSAGGADLEVLHTPGHAPDHLAFWHAATRTVFTGDLVTPGGSVMIEFSRGGSLIEYLDSLRRVRALAPRRLLPAHGPEVDDPERLIAQYLDHRMRREEQVLAALASGRNTVRDIANCIYDGLAPALLPAACENVRAHLEKLKIEGRVFEAGARWSL